MVTFSVSEIILVIYRYDASSRKPRRLVLDGRHDTSAIDRRQRRRPVEAELLLANRCAK